MNIDEFSERTGFYPSFEFYSVIEQVYMELSVDKDTFCKAYKENTDGFAERIQFTAIKKAEDAQRILTSKMNENNAERIKLMEQIENLTTQLEQEQEWRPHGHSSNMRDDEYEDLVHIGRKLTEAEAKELIVDELGFDFEKIDIVRTLPTYEINRHQLLRKIGEVDRTPVYSATDWHYVRFNVCGRCYELINGDLKHFYE